MTGTRVRPHPRVGAVTVGEHANAVAAPSISAAEYHRLYGLARWRKMSKYQLRRQPLCAICAAKGKTTAATIADHVEPHKGDEVAFWNGALQSLCKLCHDRIKKQDERRGFSLQVGVDGWPVDIRHPANKRVGTLSAPFRR